MVPWHGVHKNPCYNKRMEKAMPCHLNPNHNPTLNLSRSVPTCRDRIARFSRVFGTPRLRPLFVSIGVHSWFQPKLNKTERF